MISIRMLKLCGDAVLPPLELSNPVLKMVRFPQNGKKQM